jgi:uncharacterized damage-inducible protein DinB
MVTIQELLQELEHETDATRRTLERVPNDRLDWRPHQKSLSMGQLAMHVATLAGALAEISTAPAFDAGAPIPRPTATSTDELLATLERSVAQAKVILLEMGDAGLTVPWRIRLDGKEVGSMPRSAFLRSVLFNHWYHHRGQLTVYLRQTGAAVPAIYGPSADEQPMLQR